MSCLDVMYQVYGPAQPYFAAAYSPYHQKLAFYSKMQEAAESSSSSFASPAAAASIKEEEECSPEKERPPEAEYINARCVLFTYFQGDISAVVDEHFSRALSQPSSYSPSSSGSSSSGSAKAARSASAWRDGSFPMSQRSFPPSFWNSTYQPSSVPASLGSPLAATGHTELPFATADPYSPGSLHSHLHQGGPEPWHPAHHHHHHHHHHHPYIGTQSSSYPRPTTVHEVYSPHFDPRYGSLLVPAASVRPHRLTPASVPTSVSPQCELGKNEPATSAWTTPAPFPSPAGEVAQSLGLNVDAARRYSFCGGSLLS
ncbi:transcription cofactor vestigial-like protein 2 isoform X2 [Sphaerodactylus townsendi]|uniref:transcription cofactor vestigial-like protein 2 isoform X2 n=1 Tax=Sphaerodactylus townsendi TaxID=933632 RepID=UPI00202636D5|nr:transcription cofactor vestigial-like protein 2 isoform X2 [Sphaerodactylus townsendi]